MSRKQQRRSRQRTAREIRQELGSQSNRIARREHFARASDSAVRNDGGQGAAARQTRQPLMRAASAVGEELRSDAMAAQQAATRAGRRAWSAIRENPAPAALAGIGVVCAGAGITWLIMNGGKAADGTDGGSNETMRGPGNGARRARRIRQSLAHATEAVGNKASALAQGAVEQGRQLESSLEHTVQAHPLAVGAAMLAVGTAIGLAIPRTKLEDGFLGRERDKLVSAAKRATRGAAKKVETIARNIAEPPRPQA
jgi:hypothetical protein